MPGLSGQLSVRMWPVEDDMAMVVLFLVFFGVAVEADWLAAGEC